MPQVAGCGILPMLKRAAGGERRGDVPPPRYRGDPIGAFDAPDVGFKHLVHVDKIRRFNAVKLIEGYPAIDIRSPKEVVCP